MFYIDEAIAQNKVNNEKINEIGESINIDKLQDELTNLEKQTQSENFWNNPDESSKVLARLNAIKNQVHDFDFIKEQIDTMTELLEMLKAEPDTDLEKEAEKNMKDIEEKLNQLEITTLFSEKYDNSNAIVTIHPGAGGTEAMDWADMLYRMYTRWAEKNNFKVDELDYLPGDEAGAKSVTFLVSGEFAYGYLKSEHGVHRLVRISPFDAGGRRHTSFASIEVLPEISDDTEVDIRPEDIKMDVFRASGAGGQHINKTSSAVRLTHIPTGLVVSCQTERSQFQNRDYAMKMLKSKLINLKEREHKDTIDDLKGVQMDIAWGSQIRSYVFCPYTMVKDHRTNYEVGDVQKVMDGDLNNFIFAYLKQITRERN